MTPNSVLATSSARKAHVLHRKRKKDHVLQLFTMILRSVLVSRTKPTASNATRAESAQSIGESASDLPPHGALGGFAQATAALVASSSSGVGRLGDGGRDATKRRGEAVCVEESVHRGPRRPGLRVQKARRRRQVAASRLKQRGERERRGKGAAEEEGLVGNTWWPSP